MMNSFDNNSEIVNDTDTSEQPQIKWSGLLLGILLSCFAMITIFGNSLVIFAVFRERYLRTITNYFIVSLAVADLFMGTIVMPFAVLLEVFGGYWPFGRVWCDLWHALDVLSSTASILNLCMIALERFWATQNPIKYNTKVSKKRCLLMVGLVWFCSSLISFPAIIWWRFSSKLTNTMTCEFTEDSLYLILSAIVSFYAPLLVMIIVYYRIYLTATKLMKNLNSGTKIIYNSGCKGDIIVLRIHRGIPKSNIPNRIQESASMLSIKSSTAYNSFYSNASTSAKCSTQHHKAQILNSNNLSLEETTVDDSSSNLLSPYAKRYPPNSGLPNGSTIMTTSAPANPVSRRRSYQNMPLSASTNNIASIYCDDDEGLESTSANQSIANKLRNFAVGKRLTKFAREQKAAKTLGIVMGIFIFCWLPFFVCSVITSIDKTILNPEAFAIVTWLGYINSGINPIIYAHSMRDFRRAFIKILCSWCRRHGLINFDDRKGYVSNAPPSVNCNRKISTQVEALTPRLNPNAKSISEDKVESKISEPEGQTENFG